MVRKRRKSGRAPESVQPKTSTGLSFGVSALAGLSLLLAVLTLILYSPISGHPFVNYDDGPYITDNSHIQNGLNWETIRWAATAVYAANWHPLTWVAHGVNFDLFGRDAGGHHVTSMLLNAAITVLLFLLLAAATRSVGKSWLVAAIFGVHPLNVEAVAWAAELKTLLCTFFVLLTLGAYGWYARKPGIGKVRISGGAFSAWAGVETDGSHAAICAPAG
jgi:protein O-mannosyl-transferase